MRSGNTMVRPMCRSYRELIAIQTYLERFRYLAIKGQVGDETFGSRRYLNQAFYTSKEWRQFRHHIITRDLGCDLGDKEHEISGLIVIHHLNPITIEDIVHGRSCLVDPENAICAAELTHKAIHYGSEELLPQPPIERRPFDMCPWKR